jgi:hypothetical protein
MALYKSNFEINAYQFNGDIEFVSEIYQLLFNKNLITNNYTIKILYRDFRIVGLYLEHLGEMAVGDFITIEDHNFEIRSKEVFLDRFFEVAL